LKNINPVTAKTKRGKQPPVNLLQDILSSLNYDADVKDIRLGLFHTGVLTRNCGLAATLPRDALKQTPPLMQSPGDLLDKSALELSRMSFSDSIIEAAVGMATINSLLDIDESNCVELNARELIIKKGRNKKIAIVGHFPFISKLRDIAGQVWVLEKNPLPGDLPENEAENLIPEADVLAITGTAITNHSMEYLLGLKNSKAFVIVLGDSAILSPILFDYGIDAISGTKVTDHELAMRCIGQGANFRQITGTQRLTMLK
jgi:uncharacterized protein (DUF4213/DUF364 family)